MPSAGVLRIRSSSCAGARCAAKASAPYSTKLPASQRSAMFSRAVRRPSAWRWRRPRAGSRRRERLARAQLEQVGAHAPAPARCGRRRAVDTEAPRRGAALSRTSPSTTTSPTSDAAPRPRRRLGDAPRAPSSSTRRSRSARRRATLAPTSTAGRDDAAGERGDDLHGRQPAPLSRRRTASRIAGDRQAVEVDARHSAPRSRRPSRAPVPAAIVQPSVPWPVARKRLSIGVRRSPACRRASSA